MKLQLFSSQAAMGIAEEISNVLGIPLSEKKHMEFSNGEMNPYPLVSVRKDHVFLIHTCRSGQNLNSDLMEGLVFLRALKTASAGLVTFVPVFLPFMRQDRKTRHREPITARLVADLIKTAGADSVITVQLHSDQEQGFFEICDNLTIQKVFLQYVKENLVNYEGAQEEWCIVSPDLGGFQKADKFARKLNLPVAAINKKRGDNQFDLRAGEIVNENEIVGKNIILLDDICDTAGTISKAAKLLEEKGAKRIILLATHPVLSGKAVQTITNSIIEKVVVTNTIPIAENFEKLEVLSIASAVAESIKGVYHGESLREYQYPEMTQD